MDSVCNECGQHLPNKVEQNCSTHGIDVQAEISDLEEEQTIKFEFFESPLQEIKEKDGFITIKTDSVEGNKTISCSMVRERVDDVIDMSKYDIDADTDNCKVILTGLEEDVPTIIISFKTRVPFQRCLKALEKPFRPHLNSSVQDNRPRPTTTPRRGLEARTVTPRTLRKLNLGQFQPELVTLEEVKISSTLQWKAIKRASDEVSQSSEQSDLCHGQLVSDEDRSSSGSDIDTAVRELRMEDVDSSILQGGRHAKDKRKKKTVSLTTDQFDALQVKNLLSPQKLIITRGGVINQVTLLEGDEVMKVNGQRSQSLNQKDHSLAGSGPSEKLTITVRSCPGALCASNIPNYDNGLGITWNNTVVEEVGNGPLAGHSVFDPLRRSRGEFSLTHINGNFIPFQTSREKIHHILQKAGKYVNLVFQPSERMKAVAGLS